MIRLFSHYLVLHTCRIFTCESNIQDFPFLFRTDFWSFCITSRTILLPIKDYSSKEYYYNLLTILLNTIPVICAADGSIRFMGYTHSVNLSRTRMADSRDACSIRFLCTATRLSSVTRGRNPAKKS